MIKVTWTIDVELDPDDSFAEESVEYAVRKAAEAAQERMQRVDADNLFVVEDDVTGTSWFAFCKVGGHIGVNEMPHHESKTKGRN